MQQTESGSAGKLEARLEVPRLVFFTASTSGECRRAESWIAQVLQHRRNHRKLKLVTVDADARPDLVERFRVERLPTLVVVEQQTVQARLECPRGTREIVALVAPWLQVDGSRVATG
jgi:thioredoxin-like negative regulator of GroEL